VITKQAAWEVGTLSAGATIGDWPPLLPDDQTSARFWSASGGALRVQAVVELTVEPDVLAAALYEYSCCPQIELNAKTAGELIAAELAIFGLGGLQQRAALIAAAEQAGALAEPEWLAVCRRYVSGALAEA